MQMDTLFLLLTSYAYILLLLNLPFSSAGVCSCPNQNSDTTTGTTFLKDLKGSLGDLARNTPQNNYTYTYNVTYGKAPNQVYGLAMCYADANVSACSSCLIQASISIIEFCNSTDGGIVWYDACMMRYLNAAFNSSDNYTLLISEAKGGRISEQENLRKPEKYRDAFQQLVNGTLAANASRSVLKVAAGIQRYKKIKDMYALVQCAKQLPPDDCRRCIGALTGFILESIDGGIPVVDDMGFKAPSCYVRYAIRPFYVRPEAHAPWKSTGKRSWEPVAINMFFIIVCALLVLVVDIHI